MQLVVVVMVSCKGRRVFHRGQTFGEALDVLGPT